MEVKPTISTYRRFPLWIRAIAFILIVTFFSQDIAWAYPDTAPRNSTLAVTGIDKKDVVDKIKAAMTAKQRSGRSPRKIKDDIPAIKDAEALSDYIGRLCGSASLLEVLEDPEKYKNSFFRPLYELLFARLSADFSGSEKFIAYCRRVIREEGADGLFKRLKRDIKSFYDIRPNENTGYASIGFYGLLLYCLIHDPESRYLAHLFNQKSEITHPEENISLARKGISYHVRGDSVVHYYDRGLLFAGPEAIYTRSLLPRYEETPHEDRRGSLNAKKIEKAISILEGQSSRPGFEYLKGRVYNLRKWTSVLELDMKTTLLFSDPDNNVVRVIHAGRTKRALYVSRRYLDSLDDISNKDHMKELAVWLNYGQRFIDATEEDRPGLNARFFEEEDSGLIKSPAALKERLAVFMRKDTRLKYAAVLDDVIRREKEAATYMKEGYRYEGRRTYKQKGALKFTAEPFARALKLYGRILYRCEGLGLHSWAREAYKGIVLATSSVQLHDTGILPCLCQIALVFTALRFGQWADFKDELKTLLTGVGYPRNIERGELEILKSYLTRSPSHDVPPGSVCPITVSTFEDDMRRVIATQLSVVGPQEFKEAKDAIALLDDYFGKPNEPFDTRRPFKDLPLGLVDYYSLNPEDITIVSDVAGPGKISEFTKVRTDILFQALGRQKMRPASRDYLDSAGRIRIAGLIRDRINKRGAGLLEKERGEIEKALEAFEQRDFNILEFDAIAISHEREKKKVKSWVLGFNNMKRSENARLDNVSNELQKRLAAAFPADTAFFAKQALDALEGSEPLLLEYIFSVIVSPRLCQEASQYLRRLIFSHNYDVKDRGKLSAIFASIISRSGDASQAGGNNAGTAEAQPDRNSNNPPSSPNMAKKPSSTPGVGKVTPAQAADGAKKPESGVAPNRPPLKGTDALRGFVAGAAAFPPVGDKEWPWPEPITIGIFAIVGILMVLVPAVVVGDMILQHMRFRKIVRQQIENDDPQGALKVLAAYLRHAKKETDIKYLVNKIRDILHSTPNLKCPQEVADAVIYQMNCQNGIFLSFCLNALLCDLAKRYPELDYTTGAIGAIVECMLRVHASRFNLLYSWLRFYRHGLGWIASKCLEQEFFDTLELVNTSGIERLDKLAKVLFQKINKKQVSRDAVKLFTEHLEILAQNYPLCLRSNLGPCAAQVDNLLQAEGLKHRFASLSVGGQQLAKLRLYRMLLERGTENNHPLISESSAEEVLREIGAADLGIININYFPFPFFGIGLELHTQMPINSKNFLWSLALSAYSLNMPGNHSHDPSAFSPVFSSVTIAKPLRVAPAIELGKLELQTLPSSPEIQSQISKEFQRINELEGKDLFVSQIDGKKNTFTCWERHVSLSGRMKQENVYPILLVSAAANYETANEVTTYLGGDNEYRAKILESLMPKGELFRPRRLSAFGGERTEFLDVDYVVSDDKALAEIFQRHQERDLYLRYWLGLMLQCPYSQAFINLPLHCLREDFLKRFSGFAGQYPHMPEKDDTFLIIKISIYSSSRPPLSPIQKAVLSVYRDPSLRRQSLLLGQAYARRAELIVAPRPEDIKERISALFNADSGEEVLEDVFWLAISGNDEAKNALLAHLKARPQDKKLLQEPVAVIARQAWPQPLQASINDIVAELISEPTGEAGNSVKSEGPAPAADRDKPPSSPNMAKKVPEKVKQLDSRMSPSDAFHDTASPRRKATDEVSLTKRIAEFFTKLLYGSSASSKSKAKVLVFRREGDRITESDSTKAPSTSEFIGFLDALDLDGDPDLLRVVTEGVKSFHPQIDAAKKLGGACELIKRPKEIMKSPWYGSRRIFIAPSFNGFLLNEKKYGDAMALAIKLYSCTVVCIKAVDSAGDTYHGLVHISCKDEHGTISLADDIKHIHDQLLKDGFADSDIQYVVSYKRENYADSKEEVAASEKEAMRVLGNASVTFHHHIAQRQDIVVDHIGVKILPSDSEEVGDRPPKIFYWLKRAPDLDAGKLRPGATNMANEAPEKSPQAAPASVRVLDMGSGDGSGKYDSAGSYENILNMVRRTKKAATVELIGIDHNRGFVAQGVEAGRDIRFMDAKNTDFITSSFDIITCFAPYRRNLISGLILDEGFVVSILPEVSRLLKPDGEFWLCMMEATRPRYEGLLRERGFKTTIREEGLVKIIVAKNPISPSGPAPAYMDEEIILPETKFSIYPNNGNIQAQADRVMRTIAESLKAHRSPFINVGIREDSKIRKCSVEIGGTYPGWRRNVDTLSIGEVIDNAIDAIIFRWNEEGKKKDYVGIVSVRIERKNGSLIIEVSDDGIGIREDTLKKMLRRAIISDKQSVVRNLPTLGYSGKGVFLFYGRVFISRMGGMIEIDTLHPDNGALKLTYKSWWRARIKSSDRKTRGTTVRFTIPGIFPKDREIIPGSEIIIRAPAQAADGAKKPESGMDRPMPGFTRMGAVAFLATLFTGLGIGIALISSPWYIAGIVILVLDGVWLYFAIGIHILENVVDPIAHWIEEARQLDMERRLDACNPAKMNFRKPAKPQEENKKPLPPAGDRDTPPSSPNMAKEMLEKTPKAAPDGASTHGASPNTNTDALDRLGWNTLEEVDKIAETTKSAAAKRWLIMRRSCPEFSKSKELALAWKKITFAQKSFTRKSFYVAGGIVSAILAVFTCCLMYFGTTGQFYVIEALMSPAIVMISMAALSVFVLVGNLILGIRYGENSAFISLFWPKDFRRMLDSSPYVKEVMMKLQGLGINGNWDNPDYKRSYVANGQEVVEAKSLRAYTLIAQQALKRFIGEMENGRVKNAGDMFKTLNKPRSKCAGEFHTKYKETIESLYRGDIEREKLIYLFENLRDNFVKEGSKGGAYIDEILASIPEGAPVHGSIDARIWQRDPWHDLSHEETLNECIWLGGIHEEAALEYIRNKSVTMLDFYSGAKHLVRVTLEASTYMVRGKEEPILVVECMGGSDKLDRGVIKRAIEDYAKVCGFPYVLYNKRATNNMPRKFVKYLGLQKLKPIIIPISFVDISRKVYLELFSIGVIVRRLVCGWAIPRGIVEGYCVNILPTAADPSAADFSEERRRQSRRRFLKGAAVAAGAVSVAVIARYLMNFFDAEFYRGCLKRDADSSIRDGAVKELLERRDKESLSLLIEMCQDLDSEYQSRIVKAVISYSKDTQDMSFAEFLFNIVQNDKDNRSAVIEAISDNDGTPLWKSEAEYIAKRLLGIYEKNENMNLIEPVERMLNNKYNEFSALLLLELYLIGKKREPELWYIQVMAKERLRMNDRSRGDVGLLVDKYRKLLKEKDDYGIGRITDLMIKWNGEALPLDFMLEVIEDEHRYGRRPYPDLPIEYIFIRELGKKDSVLVKGRSGPDLERIIDKLLELMPRAAPEDDLDTRSRRFSLSKAVVSIIENKGDMLPDSLLQALDKHEDVFIKKAAGEELDKRRTRSFVSTVPAGAAAAAKPYSTPGVATPGVGKVTVLAALTVISLSIAFIALAANPDSSLPTYINYFGATAALGWKNYLWLLSEHRLLGNTLTAFLLAIISDLVAQKIEQYKMPREKRSIDWKRLAWFSLRLACFYGALFDAWLCVLDYMLGEELLAKCYKILLQGTVYTSLFYFLFFNTKDVRSLRNIFSRRGLRETWDNFKPLFKRDIVFWTCFANPVNFLLIPHLSHTNNLRVLIGNIACLCWDTYLSWRVHKKESVDIEKELASLRRIAKETGDQPLSDEKAAALEGSKDFTEFAQGWFGGGVKIRIADLYAGNAKFSRKMQEGHPELIEEAVGVDIKRRAGIITDNVHEFAEESENRGRFDAVFMMAPVNHEWTVEMYRAWNSAFMLLKEDGAIFMRLAGSDERYAEKYLLPLEEAGGFRIKKKENFTGLPDTDATKASSPVYIVSRRAPQAAPPAADRDKPPSSPNMAKEGPEKTPKAAPDDRDSSPEGILNDEERAARFNVLLEALGITEEEFGELLGQKMEHHGHVGVKQYFTRAYISFLLLHGHVSERILRAAEEMFQEEARKRLKSFRDALDLTREDSSYISELERDKLIQPALYKAAQEEFQDKAKEILITCCESVSISHKKFNKAMCRHLGMPHETVGFISDLISGQRLFTPLILEAVRKAFQEEARKEFRSICAALGFSNRIFGIALAKQMRRKQPFSETYIRKRKKGDVSITPDILKAAREVYRKKAKKVLLSFRQRLGLTQKEFGEAIAEECGRTPAYSNVYISQLEEGRAKVTQDILRAARRVYQKRKGEKLPDLVRRAAAPDADRDTPPSSPNMAKEVPKKTPKAAPDAKGLPKARRHKNKTSLTKEDKLYQNRLIANLRSSFEPLISKIGRDEVDDYLWIVTNALLKYDNDSLYGFAKRGLLTRNEAGAIINRNPFDVTGLAGEVIAIINSYDEVGIGKVDKRGLLANFFTVAEMEALKERFQDIPDSYIIAACRKTPKKPEAFLNDIRANRKAGPSLKPPIEYTPGRFRLPKTFDAMLVKAEDALHTSNIGVANTYIDKMGILSEARPRVIREEQRAKFRKLEEKARAASHQLLEGVDKVKENIRCDLEKLLESLYELRGRLESVEAPSTRAMESFSSRLGSMEDKFKDLERDNANLISSYGEGGTKKEIGRLFKNARTIIKEIRRRLGKLSGHPRRTAAAGATWQGGAEREEPWPGAPGDKAGDLVRREDLWPTEPPSPKPAPAQAPASPNAAYKALVSKEELDRLAPIIKGVRSESATTRLEALKKLREMLERGEIKPRKKSRESNNHIHTRFSYSPYFPAEAVLWSYMAGLEITGIIDHDTIDGLEEFIEAGEILGVKTTVGFEMRVNFSGSRFADRAINAPGISNMAYFLCHGLPREGMGKIRMLLERVRAEKEERNRLMTSRLWKRMRSALWLEAGAHQFDYDADVRPLAENGNTTDRHITYAMAKLLQSAYPDVEKRAAFVTRLFNGRALTEEELSQIDNPDKFMNVLRNELLKPGKPDTCYIAPSQEETPGIRTVVDAITDAGGIPVYPYLGTEDDYLEELLDYLKIQGVIGIAIMPHRNTPEQIARIIKLADARGLIVISGVDINDIEMPLIHPRARSAEYPAFRQAANLLADHELISNVIMPALIRGGAKGIRISARYGNYIYYRDAEETNYRIVNIEKEEDKGNANLARHIERHRADNKNLVIIEAGWPTAMSLAGPMPPITPDVVALLKEKGALPFIDETGDKLTSAVARELRADPITEDPGTKKTTLKGHSAVLTRNGVITAGANLREAFYRSKLVEVSARTVKAADKLGKLKYLSEDDALALLNSDFEKYRQREAAGEGEDKEIETIEVPYAIDYDEIARIREELLKVGRVCAEKDLVVGPGGNISAITSDRRIVLIKASGKAFENMSPYDYVAVDLATGKVIKGLGRLRPSTEVDSHLEIYRKRPDVWAVVHTHPPYATAYASTGMDLSVANEEPIACLGYRFPGRALAEPLTRALGNKSALLLSCHGLFTVGKTLQEALERTLIIETAAAAGKGNLPLIPLRTDMDYGSDHLTPLWYLGPRKITDDAAPEKQIDVETLRGLVIAIGRYKKAPDRDELKRKLAALGIPEGALDIIEHNKDKGPNELAQMVLYPSGEAKKAAASAAQPQLPQPAPDGGVSPSDASQNVPNRALHRVTGGGITPDLIVNNDRTVNIQDLIGNRVNKTLPGPMGNPGQLLKEMHKKGIYEDKAVTTEGLLKLAARRGTSNSPTTVGNERRFLQKAGLVEGDQKGYYLPGWLKKIDISEFIAECGLNKASPTAQDIESTLQNIFRRASSPKFSHHEKIEVFAQILLYWANLPEPDKAGFFLQPIWNGNNDMLGKPDPGGNLVTFTPEICAHLCRMRDLLANKWPLRTARRTIRKKVPFRRVFGAMDRLCLELAMNKAGVRKANDKSWFVSFYPIYDDPHKVFEQKYALRNRISRGNVTQDRVRMLKKVAKAFGEMWDQLNDYEAGAGLEFPLHANSMLGSTIFRIARELRENRRAKTRRADKKRVAPPAPKPARHMANRGRFANLSDGELIELISAARKKFELMEAKEVAAGRRVKPRPFSVTKIKEVNQNLHTFLRKHRRDLFLRIPLVRFRLGFNRNDDRSLIRAILRTMQEFDRREQIAVAWGYRDCARLFSAQGVKEISPGLYDFLHNHRQDLFSRCLRSIIRKTKNRGSSVQSSLLTNAVDIDDGGLDLDTIPGPEDPETIEAPAMVKEIFANYPFEPDEEDVLRNRFGLNEEGRALTYREIGKRLGYAGGSIADIEKRALNGLKRWLTSTKIDVSRGADSAARAAEPPAAAQPQLPPQAENRNAPSSPNMAKQGPAGGKTKLRHISMITVTPEDQIGPEISPFSGGYPMDPAQHLSAFIDERVKKGEEVSFDEDLRGARILIIGPGRRGKEVLGFLQRYPHISEIHLLNVDENCFGCIDSAVQGYVEQKGPIQTKIYGHFANVLRLPNKLKKGDFDLVVDVNVFPREYLADRAYLTKAREQVTEALKYQGVHMSGGSDPLFQDRIGNVYKLIELRAYLDDPTLKRYHLYQFRFYKKILAQIRNGSKDTTPTPPGPAPAGDRDTPPSSPNMAKKMPEKSPQAAPDGDTDMAIQGLLGRLDGIRIARRGFLKAALVVFSSPKDVLKRGAQAVAEQDQFAELLRLTEPILTRRHECDLGEDGLYSSGVKNIISTLLELSRSGCSANFPFSFPQSIAENWRKEYIDKKEGECQVMEKFLSGAADTVTRNKVEAMLQEFARSYAEDVFFFTALDTKGKVDMASCRGESAFDSIMTFSPQLRARLFLATVRNNIEVARDILTKIITPSAEELSKAWRAEHGTAEPSGPSQGAKPDVAKAEVPPAADMLTGSPVSRLAGSEDNQQTSQQANQPTNTTGPPASLFAAALDADIQNAIILKTALAKFYEDDAEKITYTIRLDNNRVPAEYIKLIKEYYTKILSSDKVEVKVLGNGKTKGLIDVDIDIGGKHDGSGTVDVKGDKGQIESLGRIIGMVNLAISVATLPEEFPESGVDAYKAILDTVFTQYQLLTGEKLVLPADPKEILSTIRAIAQNLPPIKECGTKSQEDFRLMEEKLKSAA